MLVDCFDTPLVDEEILDVVELLEIDSVRFESRGYLRPTFPLPGRGSRPVFLYCLRDFLVGAICGSLSGILNARVEEVSNSICDCLLFSIEVIGDKIRSTAITESCYCTIVKIDMLARLSELLDDRLPISHRQICQVCAFSLEKWKYLTDWFGDRFSVLGRQFVSSDY